MGDNNANLIRAAYLVLCLAIGCTCFGLPRFQSVPTTVKTFENNTVSLPCVYSGPHLGLRWYFGDILLSDSRNRLFYPPINRIEVSINGSLIVENVQSEDTGDYFCVIVFSDAPELRQEHSIEVQYPPSVTSYPSGDLRLKLGSIFEIACEASGVPQPIISWRRLLPNGAIEMLPETRRHLRVDVIDREMAGTYQCLANNGIEETAVAGVNLHVNYIPEVHSPMKSVHSKIGYRAMLECIVLASPSGTLHWYHHGVPVITDNHIARSDVDVSIDHATTSVQSKHTLLIRSVRDRDMGMYECRAENELGSKGVFINLNGAPKQSIFKSSPIRSNGRTFNLLWQTESYSPISEYRLKFRTKSRRYPAGHSDWREITIPAEYSEAPIHTAAYSLPGLEIGTVYEVAVMSRNRYGWGEQSKIYRFIGGEVDSPSKISEETVDDRLTVEGDDLSSNSVDEELPGVFDYSYSGISRMSGFNLIILLIIPMIARWIHLCSG